MTREQHHRKGVKQSAPYRHTDKPTANIKQTPTQQNGSYNNCIQQQRNTDRVKQNNHLIVHSVNCDDAISTGGMAATAGKPPITNNGGKMPGGATSGVAKTHKKRPTTATNIRKMAPPPPRQPN